MEVTLLSVDPGLHGLGVGLFRDRTLVWAGYLPAPKGVGRGPAAWVTIARTLQILDASGFRPTEVAVEVMEVYSQRWWKGDPADVLEVQGVAAAVAAQFPDAKLTGYLPKTWKGQVPQDILANRVLDKVKALGWAEAIDWTDCPNARRHDVAHGIGVGLYHLHHTK